MGELLFCAFHELPELHPYIAVWRRSAFNSVVTETRELEPGGAVQCLTKPEHGSNNTRCVVM